MRKPRNNNQPVEKFLQPFDVTQFGSEEDPCFGKEYDLTTSECQACGDHELCAISFTRTIRDKRKKFELETDVKDKEISELETIKEIKDFVKDKLSKGFSDKRAFSKASTRFHTHIDKIKQIVHGQ